MPETACRNVQYTSGSSGFPKLRPSVTPSGTAPAQARFAAHSATARRAPRYGSSAHTAPLPSTVIHTATIARVAGVPEIVITTPPNPAFAATEYVNPVILVAADLASR